MDDLIYEDTCEVTCTDNDAVVIADVIDFQPMKKLVVAIGRSVKVTLNWKTRLYVGDHSKMEFTSPGPKGRVVQVSRR